MGNGISATDRLHSLDGLSDSENENSESSYSGSYGSSSSESEELWPPKAPLLRFKVVLQFSNRFKKAGHNHIFEGVNKHVCSKIEEDGSEIKNVVIGWVNSYFHMAIETEFQFKVGFPIVILSMLDAIYPRRVLWRQVDWRFQYKRSLYKNLCLVERIWGEVNMEKAREFRVENTSLRFENVVEATSSVKLNFLKVMKRWFEVRISVAEDYDVMRRRVEYIRECTSWGHNIDLPAWIKLDKELEGKPPPPPKPYNTWPEYKRLIWFLGSSEYQRL